ncbi:hypothetical protein F4780DRAFT_773238 [Xylariomycetidae sp. FL0641]|nr:hypothetical protein F4780DRAFT_773238 [Xylariomycetidae sp. FL0641]
MVVRTPTLNSLKKGFLPQIHLPLPLNRRESQQLLDSITTSFRRNLDKEHPWQSANETASSSSIPPTNSTVASSGHHPTDRHMRAILSNPLFSHLQLAKAPVPTGGPRDPSHVFDAAVHKGLMTPRRAAGFLAAVRQQADAGPAAEVRRHMAGSGAALRVLQWLRASGQEAGLHFLSDKALVSLLVPFMCAEGLQEVIWLWLAQLATRIAELELEARPDRVNAEAVSRLMASTVREVTVALGSEPKPSLDGAYAALNRAHDLLPAEHQAVAPNLRTLWSRLSWTSTVYAYDRPKPTVPLFESFLKLGLPYNYRVPLAHLDLHHPTTPSHTAAVEYLRQNDQALLDLTHTKSKAKVHRRVICLALDAADRLKQVGRPDEASWVERLLANMCQTLDLGITEEVSSRVNIQNT